MKSGNFTFKLPSVGKRFINSRRLSRGVALVELALVLPILLLLIGGGIDLTRMLSQSTTVINLSQQIGADAFRRCSLRLYNNRIPNDPKIIKCMRDIIAVTGYQLASDLPDTSVTLSIYGLSNGTSGTPVQLFKECTISPCFQDPSNKIVDLPTFLSQGYNRPALNKQHIIVYSEVYSPKKTLLGNWWNFASETGGDFYVATMF